MKHLVSISRLGFRATPLHRAREPHAFHYLAQRTSFWLAIFSLLAFVTGNMIGQHGWQVFWKSVMGREDDSAIVYTGTVPPIVLAPDYLIWSRYGGNPQEHTYREVPQVALTALPTYTARNGDLPSIYSVGYLGSYTTGRESSGSHPAVDIRVPIGTPVRAIANGIVQEVKEGGGFGMLVIIRHPNVPDPVNPRKSTTLYSCYAHLSATYVTEGAIVSKSEQIALSGMTGDASGPHLHFQIDREEAPWHPYWPVSTDDLRAAGVSGYEAINRGMGSELARTYTVNPLLYVQANYAAPVTIVQSSSSSSVDPRMAWLTRVQQRTEQARTNRQARLQTRAIALASSQSSISSLSSISSIPVVQSREVVVSRTDVPAPVSAAVASVELDHDGVYSERGWERVRITLLDAAGHIVTSPVMDRDLVLQAAFGSAEFRPATLSVLDFQNGKAEVNVLPQGRRTLVIQVMPFNVLSQPMRYER